MKKTLLFASILVLIFALMACEGEKKEEVVIPADEQDTLANDVNEEIQENIADISKKIVDGEVEEDEAEKMMMDTIKNSKVIQDEYEKQKTLMPVYMQLSKDFRDCLDDADDLSEANNCADEAGKKADRLGLNDDEEYKDDKEDDFGNWTDPEKESFLNELDKGLADMEKSNECFEKSDSFPVAMKCMQAFQ